MRHILRTEDDLRNLVNLNDIGHLREVTDEAFRSLAHRFGAHQTDEVGLDGGAFENGVHPLCFLGTSNDQKAFFHRPLRLEVLVAQQNADEAREAHFQGEPNHAEKNQGARKTQCFRQ